MSGTDPIIITGRGDELLISAPFAAKDLVRAIPSTRWDPTRKVWVAHRHLLPVIRAALAAWPGGLHVTGDSPSRPQQATGTDWARGMFAAIPPRLHRKTYRALAAVLHPDAGGDEACMKQLAAANTEAVTTP